MARLATMGEDDQPTSCRSPASSTVRTSGSAAPGRASEGTRKVSNVLAGRRKLALVVADLLSLEPFVARGIRVYGVADGPVERVGTVGPGLHLRITPQIPWTWNVAGEPVGATWYETSRAVHDGSASGADGLS
jgi:pyridoxamine 5'-phosphate oxidase family protein